MDRDRFGGVGVIGCEDDDSEESLEEFSWYLQAMRDEAIVESDDRHGGGVACRPHAITGSILLFTLVTIKMLRYFSIDAGVWKQTAVG